MRKTLMAVALVLCGSVCAPSMVGAQAKLGIGAFGGLNIPVGQDDANSGTVFGVRGRVSVAGILRVEPYAAFAKNGDFTLESSLTPATTIEGGKLRAFGLEGGLASGGPVSFALIAGIGSFKLEHESVGEKAKDGTNTGYTVGAGLGIGVPTSPISVDGRAMLAIIPQEGGGDRKHLFATVGIMYSFGI